MHGSGMLGRSFVCSAAHSSWCCCTISGFRVTLKTLNTAAQDLLCVPQEDLRVKAGELEDALLQIEMKDESLQFLQSAARRADELDAELAERKAELALAERRLQVRSTDAAVCSAVCL